MGEAKHNRRRKLAFLRKHPYCCFCGGATPATTVDHVPSRQMFSLKRRPKGLEVPACNACNQATRQYEQVAAMLGRIYPDGPTHADRDEVGKIMHAVDRNAPGLIEEMMPSIRQEHRFMRSKPSLPKDVAGVFNCGGPLLNRSIQSFGAKLGLALYYATTDGLIVPLEGGVAVQWYSNFAAATEGIPDSIFQLLGPPKTLTQGKWGVGEQFSYAFAIAENAKMAAYFATFRGSFAVVSWVCQDASGFDVVDDIVVHRPGQVLNC
ncbi:MAG: hypothetical protein V3R66_05200 [Rhodospirillales bacterium]